MDLDGGTVGDGNVGFVHGELEMKSEGKNAKADGKSGWKRRARGLFERREERARERKHGEKEKTREMTVGIAPLCTAEDECHQRACFWRPTLEQKK